MHKDHAARALYDSFAADVFTHFRNAKKVATWRQKLVGVSDESVKRRLELVCLASESVQKKLQPKKTKTAGAEESPAAQGK